MDASIRVETIRCCPRRWPCPTCGRAGRRKQVLERSVVSLAYHQRVEIRISYAEYRSNCKCSATFRSSPQDIGPRQKYDGKVRDAVLDRLMGDGMSVRQTIVAMRRDFLLDLSEGFIYDLIRERAAKIDGAEYRRWAIERFSGVLCVDELHLGRFTLLVATDPISDIPIGFALVGSNDQSHMQRFLHNLAAHGLRPQVVVSDGSNLYPKVLAEIWPQARHQLCVFHVLQDLHGLILDAVKRLRRSHQRRGQRGRRRGRGRPRHKARVRRQMTLKEQAAYIFKHRHLIVTKTENLTASDREHLQRMESFLPELRQLRCFATRLQGVFAEGNTRHQALCRRSALCRDQQASAIPELQKVQEQLQSPKFEKMLVYTEFGPRENRDSEQTLDLQRRIRTNNHVERCNRKLRLLEKVRYKWRNRRSVVRFILLSFAYWKTHGSHKDPAKCSPTTHNACRLQ